MPNFTHKISSKGWDRDFYIDIKDPFVAYDSLTMREYRTSHGGWLEYYKGGRSVTVEELNLNLENK